MKKLILLCVIIITSVGYSGTRIAISAYEGYSAYSRGYYGNSYSYDNYYGRSYRRGHYGRSYHGRHHRIQKHPYIMPEYYPRPYQRSSISICISF